MTNWENFIKNADLTVQYKTAIICDLYSGGFINCEYGDKVCPLKGFCQSDTKVYEWLNSEATDTGRKE